MKNFFFSFLRHERIGIVWVALILLVVCGAIAFRTAYASKTLAEWKITRLLKDTATLMQKTNQQTKRRIPLREINSMKLEDWKIYCPLSDASLEQILNYKNMLGGFYTIEQIREALPALPDTMMKRLRKQLHCDESQVERIALIENNFTRLSRHPYIGKSIARELLKHANKKEKKTNFQNWESVSNFVSAGRIYKIKKYVDVLSINKKR